MKTILMTKEKLGFIWYSTRKILEKKEYKENLE